MASFLIALFLLAGPEPSAPLAPEPPQTPAPVFPARRATTAAPPANNQGLGHPTLSTPAAAEDPPVPPALTATALRDELRRSKEHRQEDQAALARERSRLEKLATDIASARAALERETKNLEERVKVAGKLKKDEAPRTTSPTSKSSPPSTSARLPGPVLAKTLKGMKPDLAAALLLRVERPLAVELLRSMRPADAGSVLSAMRPETAAELFSLMASGEVLGGSQ